MRKVKVTVKSYYRKGKPVKGYDRKQLKSRGKRGKVRKEKVKGIKPLKDKRGLFRGSRRLKRGERASSRFVFREGNAGRLVGRPKKG